MSEYKKYLEEAKEVLLETAAHEMVRKYSNSVAFTIPGKEYKHVKHKGIPYGKQSDYHLHDGSIFVVKKVHGSLSVHAKYGDYAPEVQHFNTKINEASLAQNVGIAAMGAASAFGGGTIAINKIHNAVREYHQNTVDYHKKAIDQAAAVGDMSGKRLHTQILDKHVAFLNDFGATMDAQ